MPSSDSAISLQAFQTFGDLLKYLRTRARLTQREVAIAVGYSEAQISRLEQNQRPPDLATLVALFIPALYIEDEPETISRFMELATQARGETLSASGQITFSRSVQREVTETIEVLDEPQKHNLPLQLTSFIGREKEQNEIIRLLEKNRLVTLAGIGGIGKTRLAHQVGGKLLGDFPDGVWFIPLDSVSDPGLVSETVASVFDIREGAGRPVIEILMNVLRKKTALLILDNCEHLLDSCAQLAMSLLTNCPNLKILTTSREILNIKGEATYYLPSLSIPEDNKLSAEQLTEHESIRLFMERAALALSSFQWTKENTQTVVEICRRVDGIPLAIELAAARVNILQVQEILKQLNDSFDLLANSSRGILRRQETLQASMDWSWGLLAESEQRFLRQLSIFAGGWTLESAQAICEGEALNLISSLVKKSLMMVDQKVEGETRYRFHEIVRQYARERLLESGEEERTRTRHLQFFLQLCEQAEPALRGPGQAKWFSWLFAESDNLRAALAWAEQTDVQAGLSILGGLLRYWQTLNVREGARWLSAFLQKPETHTYPNLRAKALYTYGRIMIDLQQFEASHSAAEECLALYRSCGDRQGEVDGMLGLGWESTNAAKKKELNQRALELAQVLGDVQRQSIALWQLGWSSHNKGRFVYWEKAIALDRSSGDLLALAGGLGAMGYFLVMDGEIESAQKYLDESTRLYKQLNFKPASSALLAYAQIALARGDFVKARAYLQENARLGHELGNQQDYLWSRAHLGYVALREDMIDEAHQIFMETARDFQKDRYLIGVVFALEGIAELYVAVGKPEYAARLVGWAEAARQKLGDTRPLLEQANVDKIIAACLTGMGESAFSDAYDEGQGMTLAQAINYALAPSDQ
jgi:predicted ATPase